MSFYTTEWQRVHSPVDILSFDDVLAWLQANRARWTAVAEATGVKRDTIKKIATSISANPGVQTIEALASYIQLVQKD